MARLTRHRATVAFIIRVTHAADGMNDTVANSAAMGTIRFPPTLEALMRDFRHGTTDDLIGLKVKNRSKTGLLKCILLHSSN